jgi:hypothetical protein
MKNFYILPSSEPSVLSDCHDNKLYLNDVRYLRNYQHIYITSVFEEIKNRDWVIYNNELQKSDGISFKSKVDKKIILTTDPKLIKDGVQKIDNEFLAWIIKNPTCEFVELDKNYNRGNGKYYFKIILPKEEPKDFLDRTDFDLLKQEAIEEEMDNYFEDKETIERGITIIQVDKQKRLEEAAEKYSNDGCWPGVRKKGFIEGAKYQAAIMYSEEEVKSFLDRYRSQFRMEKNVNIQQGDFIQWFNKFKKK